jgi:hypothetical protein
MEAGRFFIIASILFHLQEQICSQETLRRFILYLMERGEE